MEYYQGTRLGYSGRLETLVSSYQRSKATHLYEDQFARSAAGCCYAPCQARDGYLDRKTSSTLNIKRHIAETFEAWVQITYCSVYMIGMTCIMLEVCKVQLRVIVGCTC
jgi:hypothetical protein